MAFTNTRESGLEALIVKWLVEQNGYEEGNNADYNKEYAIDETRLFRFLQDTQPTQMSKLWDSPCIEYYYAINKYLSERHSPYKTIIAFSGECKYNDQEPPLTSAGINGFSDAKIPKTFRADPYRILIVADMFQTGFDEPLLHTMYVDKMLYDIKAVQTLSRLNRCHPKKYDTFVLDFANKPEIIEESFSRYYRTTILSGETDPNKLYDLVATMEGYQVYSWRRYRTFG